MLLPRPVLDEEGNEVDPREELVKNLLEYKKYKSVIAELSKMESDRINMESRGNLTKEIHALSQLTNVESELQDLDLYKMMRVFQKVMTQYEIEKNKPRHQVVQYPYTIASQKEFVLGRVRVGEKLSFVDLIREKPEKIYVIFSFLAILELIQLGQVLLVTGEGFNNFWVEGAASKEVGA